MINCLESPSIGMTSSEINLRVDSPQLAAPCLQRGLRVLLYSHDTMGLGHLRRNMLVAEALAEPPCGATCLLVCGALEANFFRLPERADCLTLPRWSKDAGGHYSASRLGLRQHDLVRLRSDSIRAAVEAFAPDLVIVDKVPAGAFDELLPTLQLLREQGASVVLGLRDVLDEPTVVAKEWLCPTNLDVLDRFYDEVWIYGDPQVYNAVTAYNMPKPLVMKCRFTGFLDQSRRVSEGHLATERLLQTLPTNKRLAACVVGGGQDGATLALKFAEALPAEDYHGVIIGGPLMPQEDLRLIRQSAARQRNLTVFDFLPEADVLLERADQVVAMAGYNTVCSLLSFGKPALLAPRIRPRREQAIRADRLAELGLVDTAPLETLTPADIRQWLLSATQSPHRAAIDLGGLEVVRDFATRLTTSRRATSAAIRVTT